MITPADGVAGQGRPRSGPGIPELGRVHGSAQIVEGRSADATRRQDVSRGEHRRVKMPPRVRHQAGILPKPAPPSEIDGLGGVGGPPAAGVESSPDRT